jgi:hypothetical protein
MYYLISLSLKTYFFLVALYPPISHRQRIEHLSDPKIKFFYFCRTELFYILNDHLKHLYPLAMFLVWNSVERTLVYFHYNVRT